MRRLALLAGAMLVAAAVLSASAGAAGRGAPAGRQVVPGGQVPAWTNAAPEEGAVPASQGVSARVWLAPRNAAELASLAQAVSDPSSAEYGWYLTKSQYAAEFAPSSDQVAAVTSWLTGAGLHVDSIGPDNHYVAVSGTAAAIQSAFGTQLAFFTVNGSTQQAPSSSVTAPSSVSSLVQAVTGLTKVGHMVQPADYGPPGAFVNAQPCSSYYGQQTATSLPKFNGASLPYAICGYTPDQLRGAYGVTSARGGGALSQLGRGQTVAIVDAFDASTLQSDANTYSARHDTPTFGPGQFQDLSVAEPDPSVIDPATGQSYADECGGNGWYGEQTLDVEAVHSMAPGANVDYYGAYSCEDSDLLASEARIVADDKASIVSNSWGEPTFVNIGGTIYATIDQGEINAYESVFQQGAVEGIGFYFSSGDDGDNGDPYLYFGVSHPDWPTEDPWVTSVGGTSLAIGRNNQRMFETGWGTAKWSLSGTSWAAALPIYTGVPFDYGAGGGFTELNGAATFARPWYQNGSVPASSIGRGVPDVGLDADPTTGMLVGETQDFADTSVFGPAGVHYGEYRIGGTSLASPLMAGVQADAQSGMRWPFRRIGFANPLLYALSRLPGVFYDVSPQGDAGNVRADYANGLNASGGIVYSVRTFDQDSSLTTGPGWDDVSGLGSPTGTYLNVFSGHVFGH